MYSVGEHEIDLLSASYGSIFQGACGAALGITVTCLVTIFTVDLSDRAFAAFVAVGVLTGLSTLVLAGLAIVEYRQVSANVKRIKERRSAP
jgi:hypothetical protein